MEIFANGGLLLIFILILTGIALFVFIDRMLRIRKISIDHQDFLQGVFTVLDKGNKREAIAICEDAPGPIPALVYEAIVHHDSRELRTIIASTAQIEIARIERRSQIIKIFAQLLPVLGLIGACYGAYLALMTITQNAPLVDAPLLAIALSKSLIITIAGLVGSVCCYMMYYIVTSRIDVLILDVDATAVLVLDHFTTEFSDAKK